MDVKNKKVKLPRGTDKRIADTVVVIVGDFLASRINAGLYVCDNSDGKEAIRSRKFLSWFDYFDHPSTNIIQISNNFTTGEMLVYSCLLVHRQNKRVTDLILAYLELTKEEDK